MDSKIVLFLGSTSLLEQNPGISISFFSQLSELAKHIYANMVRIDRFVLVIPNDHLQQLLDDVIYTIPQVHQIYVYYEHYVDMKQDEDRLQQNHTKLRFRRRGYLQNLIIELADDTALNRDDRAETISTTESRLSAKRARADDHQPSTAKRLDHVRNISKFWERKSIIILL